MSARASTGIRTRLPMMIVLSLSSSCEASIEGIVPDAERGRAMSECWLCAGDGEGGRKDVNDAYLPGWRR